MPLPIRYLWAGTLIRSAHTDTIAPKGNGEVAPRGNRVGEPVREMNAHPAGLRNSGPVGRGKQPPDPEWGVQGGPSAWERFPTETVPRPLQK